MNRIYPEAITIVLVLCCGCNPKTDYQALDNFSKGQLGKWNHGLTEVIITDVLNPPVCSRAYAYSNIAAYEALRAAFPEYPSYAKHLNGLTKIPPATGNKKDYYFPVSGIIAFATVAKKMVFNSEAIGDMENAYLKQLDSLDMDDELLHQSINYGRVVGQHIIGWAAKDGYLQRNSNPGYLVTKEAGRWQPTPPNYSDAIEPNWGTVRPFTLDSASQFRPVPPPKFDSIPNSGYFKDVMQVYDAVNHPLENYSAIANFWDCNPNISVTQGHVTYFQQKISPGGHWIYIACSVCEKEKYDEMKTAEIISKVAITIADAFISCWEAKYHYNTTRPETVINRYIDKEWKPILQTPPFPEYPSGHSVASAAASTILTYLVRDNYAFIDSTELPFGMPSRKFHSFNAAANEASLSRMYGGIHYLPALNNGAEQGRKISNYIIAKFR